LKKIEMHQSTKTLEFGQKAITSPQRRSKEGKKKEIILQQKEKAKKRKTETAAEMHRKPSHS
jgi:hypothetical protein